LSGVRRDCSCHLLVIRRKSGSSAPGKSKMASMLGWFKMRLKMTFAGDSVKARVFDAGEVEHGEYA